MKGIAAYQALLAKQHYLLYLRGKAWSAHFDGLLDKGRFTRETGHGDSTCYFPGPLLDIGWGGKFLPRPDMSNQGAWEGLLVALGFNEVNAHGYNVAVKHCGAIEGLEKTKLYVVRYRVMLTPHSELGSEALPRVYQELKALGVDSQGPHYEDFYGYGELLLLKKTYRRGEVAKIRRQIRDYYQKNPIAAIEHAYVLGLEKEGA